ncbi:MAG: hypothetical protein M5U09_14680 [Gammaproteobacteria bacterium]|nr:hypothetical protein [Gammaproteobacteria bacterium]
MVEIESLADLVDGVADKPGHYKFIGEDVGSVDLQNEDYTNTERWQKLRAAGIEALLNLEVFSSSTSNLDALKGAAELLGLNAYEYTTASGTQALVSALAADPGTGAPRIIGDRVWVSEAYIGAKGLGETLSEGVYEYKGDDGAPVDRHHRLLAEFFSGTSSTTVTSRTSCSRTSAT